MSQTWSFLSLERLLLSIVSLIFFEDQLTISPSVIVQPAGIITGLPQRLRDPCWMPVVPFVFLVFRSDDIMWVEPACGASISTWLSLSIPWSLENGDCCSLHAQCLAHGWWFKIVVTWKSFTPSMVGGLSEFVDLKSRWCNNYCLAEYQVWPDLVKICHFDKILKILDPFLRDKRDNILNIFIYAVRQVL